MEWEEKVEEQRKNDKHKKREHRDRSTPVFMYVIVKVQTKIRNQLN